MIDPEEVYDIKMENLRLAEENDKLRKSIANLSQTINRLIVKYISVNRIA